jgi:hypothetical protein
MSSTELVVRYLAERSRPRVLGPLALLLATAGLLIAPSGASVAPYILSSAQALLLVLAFRVWDDLADRERDATEHPERIMVSTRQTTPFIALGMALAVAAIEPIVFATDVQRRTTALFVAAVCLAIWYRARRSALASLLGEHVVLIKYPAVAFAVAPGAVSFDTRTAVLLAVATLASLYLVLCIYESFDDPALRASARARRIAITELALLIPLIIASASFSGVGLL